MAKKDLALRRAGLRGGDVSEEHDLVAPRAKLTSRAIAWATDALARDDTTVSALARHLGVDWHTLWDAIEVEATHRLADPERMRGRRPRR